MTRDLPSGVVTLLFTDIEGSTRLLHELGDGYGAALAEHRRIVRETCTAHDGIEVDTQGDAFFVAFARATDAVAAATEAQRRLAGGPIRVRIGVHTGEPRVTDEGYVGLDVHRGARIAAIGHGGQVLLSEATCALVDAPTRDLGAHRLKDLSAPERIHQLEIDGLPADFPLLKTIEAGIKNLPAPNTSFVGRTHELDEIDRLLGEADCRLLTLLGPGGAGKTRLALEAAARRAERYPHGAHFVPLAPVASPDFIAHALAESIQFAFNESPFSAREQLLDFLSERSTLLVLDNFEHLVAGSGFLGEVIAHAPQVELLATSRERLNVQSEWILDVEGLGLAENGNGSASALHLFVDRATQVAPSFALDDAERAQALRICRLVDGMPLGIELAASWVSTLRCSEIADEIEGNIDFLATSMRDVPERHRSLRAAIDQSWNLLTDEHRRAFSRLSIFRGGFDRLAASAVARADLRLLSELVAKSLVRRPDFGRFELHELLRQYASEQLRASPDDESDARKRHAHHYSARLLERQATLTGPAQAVARDELRGDLDNLRAAVEWMVRDADEDAAREVIRALAGFFFVHSWFDGAETLERLIAIAGLEADDLGGASDVALSAVASWAGLGSFLGYDPALDDLVGRCLPVLREREMHQELGVCLLALGVMALYRARLAEALPHLEEALAIAEAIGDGHTENVALAWLGWVRLELGDLDAARDAFDAEFESGEKLGGPILRAYARSKLGIHADAEGRYGDALRLHMEATELFASIGDAGGIGSTLSRASMSAYGLGDYPEALRLGTAGYEATSEVNHRWGTISALCRIGFAALALGDAAEAGRRFSEALERAHGTQAVSLELHAISGIGAILAEDPAEQQRAAVLLGFALGHEQLPAWYAAIARPALERLEGELPPQPLAAAREEAAGLTLEEALRIARERSTEPVGSAAGS